MGLVAFTSVGFLLLVAVGLSVEQWSGLQEGQDPLRLQQQQSSLLANQQAAQSPQGAASQSVTSDSRKLFQDPSATQSEQILQAPEPPLTWQYPLMPEEPKKPTVPFVLRIPSPSESVAAQCGENFVQVEVKNDFYGNGQLVNPMFLNLGGCGAVGQDPDFQVLLFESELHMCGSSLTMTADELVYTFTLHYTPEALGGTPIVRANAAAVTIECHYPRQHNVSSNALMPSWVPFSDSRVAEEVLVLSLKLMTDDWLFERPSNQYYLGQFLNMEASVRQYNHVPLRVFIDGCVATAVPDENSVPRYSFIENNGCFVDAKLTDSSSRFKQRVQDNKLQFQLEVFTFQQNNSNSVYITCAIKAVVASTPTSPENKACSFNDGWYSADDNNQVCACCDSSLCDSSRKGRSVPDSEIVTEAKGTIGPIVVSEL